VVCTIRDREFHGYVSAPGEDEYSSCGGSSPCKTITHAFALE